MKENTGCSLSMLVEMWGRACAVLCDWVYREKVDCETHKIACWFELCVINHKKI